MSPEPKGPFPLDVGSEEGRVVVTKSCTPSSKTMSFKRSLRSWKLGSPVFSSIPAAVNKCGVKVSQASQKIVNPERLSMREGLYPLQKIIVMAENQWNIYFVLEN